MSFDIREREMLKESTIVSVTDRQISSELGEESVILDLDGGVYYGLDAVGTRIWQLIQNPVHIREVVEKIKEEYDVSEQRCKQDILVLLDDLYDRGLISIQDTREK